MWIARLLKRGFRGRQAFSPGEDDPPPRRTPAEVEEARKMRDGILKGIAFIEARSLNPRAAEFLREKTAAELSRLEEICRES